MENNAIGVLSRRDFMRAVDTRNPACRTSSIEESIESHLMCFACEESRLNGIKADVRRV